MPNTSIWRGIGHITYPHLLWERYNSYLGPLEQWRLYGGTVRYWGITPRYSFSACGSKKKKREKRYKHKRREKKKKTSGRHPSRPISGPMKNELRANISPFSTFFFLCVYVCVSFLCVSTPLLPYLYIYIRDIKIQRVIYTYMYFCVYTVAKMDLFPTSRLIRIRVSNQSRSSRSRETTTK